MTTLLGSIYFPKFTIDNIPKLGFSIPIMGIQADALFSKTQQRVLALLFGQPEKAFYLKEIIDWAKSGTGTVQRELSKLEQADLLRSWKVGH